MNAISMAVLISRLGFQRVWMLPRSGKGVRVRLQDTCAAAFCIVSLVSCGGKGNDRVNNVALAAPTIVNVVASCTPSSILNQQTSQCTATVAGTGNFSPTVTWAASGNGAIDPNSGLFTAAATVPLTTQATIVATSTQDTTKSGSAIITLAAISTVNSVSASCNPSTVQSGQLTACAATVGGIGAFSPNVIWTASAGTIDPNSGVYLNTAPGTYAVTATSQQDSTKTGSASITVVNGVNNVLPIVVDAGPTGNYANGAFATVTVCAPGTSSCQTIDHVLVDTGSVGLRLLAQGPAEES